MASVCELESLKTAKNGAAERPAALTRPLRTMFCLTSMPVGGAETLLVNLVRELDPAVIEPEVICLKEPGPLGELLAEDFPVHSHLLSSKWDVRVLPRLAGLFRKRQADAIVTVGAGDKMFWGRLAARLAGVPVVCSALHSTGWPDGVGRLNRWLTRTTDGFIAVAKSHGEFLVDFEKFPSEKVFVIPNGVDTNRFSPTCGDSTRKSLGFGPTTPLIGILAALRPEKNHELFLQMAARVRQRVSDTEFLIIGDGPCRLPLEAEAKRLGVTQCVHFLGSRRDIPDLLPAIDLLALTSHNEANPVSILESMSCGTPVVSVDVGSIHESISDGVNGNLVAAGNLQALSDRVVELLDDPVKRSDFGARARQFVVENASLLGMVNGYQELLTDLYCRKARQ